MLKNKHAKGLGILQHLPLEQIRPKAFTLGKAT